MSVQVPAVVRKKHLSHLLRSVTLNNDNLHRIAITNLSNTERHITRWWTKKYRQPIKPFDEHTWEELLIEMLEDYYSSNMDEAEKFMAGPVEDWDGKASEAHEEKMQKHWATKAKVDLSKYKSDEELSPEKEQEILAGLGQNLPGSKRLVASAGRIITNTDEKFKVLGDEFEDNY